MNRTGPPDTLAAPSKSTLFCSECGYQNRYDDEWVIVETARETSYLCPECGTEITTRPTFERFETRKPALLSSAVRTWQAQLHTWQTVLREMLRSN
jgi:predicted RNA-binding Zn-ribbon protein involved in translation (DUF1610 family)